MNGSAVTSERIPLSFGQEQLWFLDQLNPGHGTYNIAMTYRLSGALDVAALRRALVMVQARHEALRTSFGSTAGSPFQVVLPATAVEVGLEVEDVEGLIGENGTGVLEGILGDEARAPFDLSSNPLFRVRLLRLSSEDHILCLTVHHAVADGWSLGVITSELSQAYVALAKGDEPSWEDPPVQYGDFAMWQRDHLQGELLERQLAYWQQALTNLPVLDVPADRPRPAVPSHEGDMIVRQLGQEAVDALRRLAREHGVSLFQALTAVLNVVLAHYTTQEDLVVGTTMLGRARRELERVVGMFVNMVVLRVDVSGDPSFAELLARVRDVTLDAYDHQDVPFEKVVERVAGVRDPSRNPLFQVAVQLLSGGMAGRSLELPGIDVEPELQSSGGARFDLSLTFIEADTSLKVMVEYATDLFDQWRVEQFITHLARVIDAVSADPGLRLSAIPLLSQAEREELLAAGTGEDLAYRREPVHVIIAEQARRDPIAIAATFEGDELSYGALESRATQLAHHLRSLGVRHEDIVAVSLDRGLDAIVALVGVLKAGAAFAVIDSGIPTRRQQYILDDTATRVVITRSDLLPTLPEPAGWAPLCLDTDLAFSDEAEASEPLEEWATGDSLAYVLYTSGTTGTPKGVLIEHRALMLFLGSFIQQFDFGPEDRLLQYASLVFDLSEAEIFSALTCGATLVLGSTDTLLSPDALAELIRRERVTYIGAPPAMLALLEPAPYPNLRGILGTGEAFSGEVVNRWNLDGRHFFNGYGPTETAIGCVAYECEHIEWRSSPPIGRPLPHRRLYVVDRWGNLAPVGVPGELLIGGDEGLARGYLNQPQLTAQRFVADPFRSQRRVYHSGDLVRWTPDGQLEFRGRIDNQVKVRGLRIELEEIEAVLAAHPDVVQTVVALREDTPGEKHIVAYVVARRPEITITDLRAHVASELPAYMIPSAWLFLDAIPLNFSGKVDRAALPAPEITTVGRVMVPPRTPTEELVASVFADVLDLEAAGAADSFFELGGTSLQAIRLASRLTDLFHVTVTVRSVYGAVTVEAMAAKIEELGGAPVADHENDAWTLLAEVEDMSEDEVARLLEQMT